VVWATAPISPHYLQYAMLVTLLLHAAMVCSDPDPIKRDRAINGISAACEEVDPVEVLLEQDRKLRAYYSGKAPVMPTCGYYFDTQCLGD
jgi:hypothetical protein